MRSLTTGASGTRSSSPSCVTKRAVSCVSAPPAEAVEAGSAIGVLSGRPSGAAVGEAAKATGYRRHCRTPGFARRLFSVRSPRRVKEGEARVRVVGVAESGGEPLPPPPRRAADDAAAAAHGAPNARHATATKE